MGFHCLFKFAQAERSGLVIGGGVQFGVAIAVELLDVGVEVGAGAAAIEHGDAMPPGEGVVDDRWAEERGAAEHEDVEGAWRGGGRLAAAGACQGAGRKGGGSGERRAQECSAVHE